MNPNNKRRFREFRYSTAWWGDLIILLLGVICGILIWKIRHL